MSFTDRFVKVPIKVFDAKEKELTNNETLIDCFIKFLPFEISNFKPTDDNDDDFGTFRYTHVTLKNGYSFFVYMHIDEFEKLLNEHNERT